MQTKCRTTPVKRYHLATPLPSPWGLQGGCPCWMAAGQRCKSSPSPPLWEQRQSKLLLWINYHPQLHRSQTYSFSHEHFGVRLSDSNMWLCWFIKTFHFTKIVGGPICQTCWVSCFLPPSSPLSSIGCAPLVRSEPHHTASPAPRGVFSARPKWQKWLSTAKLLPQHYGFITFLHWGWGKWISEKKRYENFSNGKIVMPSTVLGLLPAPAFLTK